MGLETITNTQPPPEIKPEKPFGVDIKDPFGMWTLANNMKTERTAAIGTGNFELKNSTASLKVYLKRWTDNFAISTEINTNSPKVSKDIFSELINSHKNAEQLEGNLVIPGQNDTYLSVNFQNDEFKIETGKIITQPDGKKVFHTGTKMDQTGVINAVEDTSHIIKTIIEKMYKLDGSPIPDENLILQPPEKKISDIPKGAPETLYDEKNLLKMLEIKNPHESFNKVGGNQEAKEEFKSISEAIGNPLEYRLDGLIPPKGILLFGPPGTGKTLLVKALASETDAQFLYLKGSDIYSRWVGDSEKFLDAVFKLARNSKENTIIFLDEIDKITPHITSESNEVTNRVSGTLQTILDGMESNENFTVVAATNRLDLVNPDVIRPGRFDQIIEVGLPNIEARKEILDIHMEKIQNISNQAAKEKAQITQTEIKEIKLFDNLDFNSLLLETEGLSGADIAKIINLAAKERSRQKEKTPINTELLKKCINKRKEEIKKQNTPRNIGSEEPQESNSNVPIYE